MALKQTRRTVSISRLAMAKLQIFADNRGESMSGIVEYWIERGLRELFDADAYSAWNARRIATCGVGRPRKQLRPEPGKYAHLFGTKCRRCGGRGHYAKTCGAYKAVR